jgi:hypothetical protein
VLYSWPAVPRTIFENRKTQLQAQSETVSAAIGRGRILGTQEDFTFSDGDFFDTIHHLAAPGRTERTSRLIEQFKRWRDTRAGGVPEGAPTLDRAVQLIR